MTEGRPLPSQFAPVHGAGRTEPLRIAYFLNDLSDPAGERRVQMLRMGGAEVTVLGFRRSAQAPQRLAGAPTFDLGRTYDGRFLQRAWMTGRWSLRGPDVAKLVRGAEVMLARNLEMLAVATAARRRLESPPGLVYECLDIHRLMVAAAPVGNAMRAVEARLMAAADLLLVSSPAFLDAYFAPRHGIGGTHGPRAILVENRVLAGTPPPTTSPRPAGRPWRILWLGIIRCRRSLQMLTALAARRPDLLEVVIRGRPTTRVFPDLVQELGGLPSVRFGGPFANEELPQLYHDTHFTWAVDYFDEGRNSTWLRPNRLYQGGYYLSVPIARARGEIARWLREHRLGVVLDDPERDLEAFLEQLTPESYGRLEAASLAAPRSLFCADEASCRALVQTLGQARAPAGRA